jgi:uncharacterized damage-inducible protein DinB
VHPRITELVSYLEQSRTSLLASVEGRTAEELARRPGPDAWSALEILDHLSLVERGIAARLASLVEQARQLGPDHATDSVLRSLDAFSITTATRRFQAPPRLHPRDDLTLAETVAALRTTRARLLEAVEALDGLAIAGIRFPHPMLGEFNLYQWILFVGQHEERHTKQIRRALERVAVTPP